MRNIAVRERPQDTLLRKKSKVQNNIHKYCFLYKKGEEIRMCICMCWYKHKDTQETKKGESKGRTGQMR